MTVTILYFAKIRSLLGISRETYPTPKNVEEILKLILEAHPALKTNLDSCAISVNEEYVFDKSHELKDGDIVALIPPVSGG